MSEDSNQDANNAAVVSNPLDPADNVSMPDVSQWQDQSVDSGLLAGLLRNFENRAGEQGRRIGMALAKGQPYHMAAMAGGITGTALSQWMKQDPAIRQCVTDLEAMGFARSLESEAYKRAMAGPEDRGSMRALEMLLKSRSPRYREKTQVQMDVVHKAETADAGVIDGWSDDASQ